MTAPEIEEVTCPKAMALVNIAKAIRANALIILFFIGFSASVSTFEQK
jgi:hypothetical protein